jgi:hypothetical protein
MEAYKLYLWHEGTEANDVLHYSKGKLKIKDFDNNNLSKFSAIFKNKEDATKAKEEFVLNHKGELEERGWLRVHIQKITIH